MKCMVMVRYDLDEEPQRTRILKLMAQEREHIEHLMKQKVINTYYVSNDRSFVWITMNGESPDHIRQQLEQFPLYPYMHVQVKPLLVPD
jgi:muconolactone delta-isomerase